MATKCEPTGEENGKIMATKCEPTGQEKPEKVNAENLCSFANCRNTIRMSSLIHVSSFI
ncbi:hypothetical protein DPMN_000581 [Dreissena polymorpha]|uniref:Uncharacterized protein n=1 Tax=Dreissena polymorpha TaxID=45954 RepID=A0A9D4MJU9_DREPO|nr:hypothetical protein DPMN_000581 [Dreissena polymorpha]